MKNEMKIVLKLFMWTKSGGWSPFGEEYENAFKIQREKTGLSGVQVVCDDLTGPCEWKLDVRNRICVFAFEKDIFLN